MRKLFWTKVAHSLHILNRFSKPPEAKASDHPVSHLSPHRLTAEKLKVASGAALDPWSSPRLFRSKHSKLCLKTRLRPQ